MNRAEYSERMRACRAFGYFGIEPRWDPEKSDIDGFIHDEVVRQGHDTRVEQDGGRRRLWMRGAWDYATVNVDRLPDLGDVIKLGSMIEPEANLTVGFRAVRVRVAGQICAPPERVPELMARLVAKLPRICLKKDLMGGVSAREYRENWDRFAEYTDDLSTADDWYVAFEAVHPFVDGNGRAGKILHNWLLDTLDDPVLVKDYFGGGNP